MRGFRENDRAVALATLIACACLVAPAAVAQEGDGIGTDTSTMVWMWDVHRQHWGDFEEFYEGYQKPVFEELFADGVVTEYGIDSQVLHSPKGWTHSVWISAGSKGALLEAAEAYADMMEARMGDGDDEQIGDYAEMIENHRDYLIDTDGMRSNAIHLDDGYWAGSTVKVGFGHGDDWDSYYANRIQPLFEELLGDGTIVAYGHSDLGIMSDEPGYATWWYVVPDAASLDAVDEKFDADWGALDEEGRRARWSSIASAVDVESYRQWISRIHDWRVAAH